MCGRSSLNKTEKQLEERFQSSFYSEDLERYNPIPSYNVAPSNILPVILNSDIEHFNPLRWGFIPFWAKDKNIGYKMINARIETILEKNSFKKAAHNKRCLIPGDGFYEWKKTGSSKTPYRIIKKDESLFAFAGLWSSWTSENGEKIDSFTILTQKPNSLVAEIHDRMPVILLQEQEELWLSTDIPIEELINIIAPFPSDLMEAYPVSDRVNKVSNNDPSLIERQDPDQGLLF
jgi:putative SOS response-associated peptidase YedK